MRAAATATLLLSAACAVAAPLIGLALAGLPLEPYLDFPPRTQWALAAPFAWDAFVLLSVPGRRCDRVVRLRNRASEAGAAAFRYGRFPSWGWIGVGIGAAGWILAWSDGLVPNEWRRHTFLALWLGYILVVNGLAIRRTGRSPLTHRTGWFLALFPGERAVLVALRIPQPVRSQLALQRHRRARRLGLFRPGDAALLLSSACGREHLGLAALVSAARRDAAAAASRPSGARVDRARCGRARPCRYRSPAGSVLRHVVGCAAIGAVRPAADRASRVVLRAARARRLRPLLQPALAALVCGFFWEMWNYGSLAKWHYSIPYASAFYVFEMPLLGYAGYLPVRRRVRADHGPGCADRGRAAALAARPAPPRE
jgi:hypothetical protein